MTRSLSNSIGQKLFMAFEGRTITPQMKDALRRWRIGGVTLFRHLNVDAPRQVRQLTADLQRAAVAADLPPLFIAADQEGGQLMAIDGGTEFPGNMALGATCDPELARHAGFALGKELAAMGINVDYAPVCDVNSNPQNPVIGTRSFGEDPAQVAKFSAAMVEGIQSAGVTATAKHFPGHGDTASDSHLGTPTVSHDLNRLRQMEFPPFAAAIEAGVHLMMTAHIALPQLHLEPDLPATLSPKILKELLREMLGFRGVIISDAMDMKAIRQGEGLAVDAITAVAAGVDILLLTSDRRDQQRVFNALHLATKRGLLSRTGAQASAARVRALKTWLAQFAQPALDVVGCAKHQLLAQEIADRSVTLVRDETRQLPLRLPAGGKIAVILPQPANLTPADTSSSVQCALPDALRRRYAAVVEFAVAHHPTDAEIDALKKQAHRFDTIVIGTLNAFMQDEQPALVKAMLATGAPTVVVAMRMPYDLMKFPAAPTYVCSYSLLPPSMEAVAKVLFGEIPAKGKLPVSIPTIHPAGYRL